jgi:CheY-like chemotaxis protein
VAVAQHAVTRLLADVDTATELGIGVLLPAMVLHGARMLLVEDDPHCRELLTVVARASGAEVTAVASAQEASRSRRPPPPRGGGYALIRRLCDSRWQGPAVALTAYASEDRGSGGLSASPRETGRARGADPHVVAAARRHVVGWRA